MENELWLSEAKFVFTQPGNSSGTTEEYEELIVEVEGEGDISKGNFLVLRTPTGWSINNPEELLDTLNLIVNSLPNEKNKK